MDEVAGDYAFGIDAGSSILKIVVVGGDGGLASSTTARIGGDPTGVVGAGVKKLLRELGVKRKQATFGITGRNGRGVAKFAEYESELSCLAAGGAYLVPGVRTVVDTGSFSNKVVKVDSSGRVVEYAVNDVCSSGAGMFLELVCKSLDVSLDELGSLALEAGDPVPISSQCSIFAESEVIYLMNEGKGVPEIAAGVCQSIVGRIAPLVSKLRPEPDFLLAGGVAKNPAVRSMLSRELGAEFVDPGVDPQLVGAFGAAVLGKGAGGDPGTRVYGGGDWR
ncbi:MAG: acyl-CoA dehydratase activase [Promethearchaeota archaeon]